MIEVRNSSQPRDAGKATSDTSLRISHPIPQTSLPYTIHKNIRYVILLPVHPMLLPYTSIPQRTRPHTPSNKQCDVGYHCCRLDFTQHCPGCPESDEKTTVGLAMASCYSTIIEGKGQGLIWRRMSTSIHWERVRSCRGLPAIVQSLT
jgi:hypothetical protein